MMLRKSVISLTLITLSASVFMPGQADAIPAFARRYKVSCSTCHAPFPKLTAYGNEFAGNGFVMKENEKARDYVSAGDDLLWLNKDFPIAARFDGYAVYDQDQHVDKDLQVPWGLKLLSGGALYRNIGYYFYFYMSERGEVAGIEDAYIHFDNVFGTNLDILVGQFQTSDPLMKRELRLTYEDYLFYKTSFGTSHTDLAYDRGLMFMYGIEKTGTDLVAMVVNGNGKDEAGSDKKFDDDANKNVGFRISQAVGDYLRVGGFYYRGKEDMVGRANEITYVGPDVNLVIDRIEVTAQYLERKDTNPLFSVNPKDYFSQGVIAEVIFSPHYQDSRYYFTGLYNRINSDLYEYHSFTASGTYLISRNLRLIGEYTRDLEFDTNRIVFGMVSGF